MVSFKDIGIGPTTASNVYLWVNPDLRKNEKVRYLGMEFVPVILSQPCKQTIICLGEVLLHHIIPRNHRNPSE